MLATQLQLATGPVTWGVDFADAPSNLPWEQVLDQIASSGLGALELGPVGYLPEDPERLAGALRSRGLRAVGSFVFDDFHEPAKREQILAVSERACSAIAAAGGTVLVIIDRPGGERVRTAGRSDAAPRMTGDPWLRMVDLVDEVGALARAHGLRPAFHPHAGSWVEFEDEIERLLEDATVGLCLDLGHAAFAGIDADRALAVWSERLVHLHLKDVDPDVVAAVRRERLDFWQAVGASVFCPLGDGVVDLAAVAASLERQGYEGFATIEQDRRPGGGDPLADLERSLAALARAGIAAASGSPSQVKERAE